jgi:hypothetical protein
VYNALGYQDTYDQILLNSPNGTSIGLPRGFLEYTLFYESKAIMSHPFKTDIEAMVWIDQHMDYFSESIQIQWIMYKMDALDLFVELHHRLPSVATSAENFDPTDVYRILDILFHLLKDRNYNGVYGIRSNLYANKPFILRKYILSVGNYNIQTALSYVGTTSPLESESDEELLR